MLGYAPQPTLWDAQNSHRKPEYSPRSGPWNRNAPEFEPQVQSSRRNYPHHRGNFDYQGGMDYFQTKGMGKGGQMHHEFGKGKGRCPQPPSNHQYKGKGKGAAPMNSYPKNMDDRRPYRGYELRQHGEDPYDSGKGHGKGMSYKGGGKGKPLLMHRNQVDWEAKVSPMDWNVASLAPFQKNLYQEHPEVRTMTDEEADKIREHYNITILSGNNIPKPVTKFEHAAFPPYVMDYFRNAGFQGPTGIQTQGWPVALSGRDMVGIAETGSGKTLAFVCPAIVHIAAQPPLAQGEGPIVLVLAPTRELAEQINEEVKNFGSMIRHACVYGGSPRNIQRRALYNGVEIVIATPGRLIDFLESNDTNLKRTTYFCLDEADRMLDMGFEPQIRTVVSQVRPGHQTLMWSATWPREIQTLALDLCQEEPVHINIGAVYLKACHSIQQIVEVIEERRKLPRLLDFLQDFPPNQYKTLVFVSTKLGTDQLSHDLRRHRYQATSLHGDKKQSERERVLSQFKFGHSQILVATDVAGRGLDVKGINLVINFDFPAQIENYVHRIGRTGRAGKPGIAVSFFTMENIKMARQLISILREAQQDVPEPLTQLLNRPTLRSHKAHHSVRNFHRNHQQPNSFQAQQRDWNEFNRNRAAFGQQHMFNF